MRAALQTLLLCLRGWGALVLLPRAHSTPTLPPRRMFDFLWRFKRVCLPLLLWLAYILVCMYLLGAQLGIPRPILQAFWTLLWLFGFVTGGNVLPAPFQPPQGGAGGGFHF